MASVRILRLREGLAALSVSDETTRPVCVRLDAGTVVLVLGEVRASGLVEVASETHRFNVFAEDLLAKSEPIASRAPVSA